MGADTVAVPAEIFVRFLNVLERFEQRVEKMGSVASSVASVAPSTGLLTVTDVGVMLGKKGQPMSRRQIERLVKAGKLRKVPHLGKRTTRFRPADVERLLVGDQPGGKRL